MGDRGRGAMVLLAAAQRRNDAVEFDTAQRRTRRDRATPVPGATDVDAGAVAGDVVAQLDRQRDDIDLAQQTIPGLPAPLMRIVAPLLGAIRSGQLRVTAEQAKPLLTLLADLAHDLADAVAEPPSDVRGAMLAPGTVAISDVVQLVVGTDVRRWLRGEELFVSSEWLEAHPVVITLPRRARADRSTAAAPAGVPRIGPDDDAQRQRAEQAEREQAERQRQEQEQREQAERQRQEQEQREQAERQRQEQEQRERAERQRQEQEQREQAERQRQEQEQREQAERQRQEQEQRERAERQRVANLSNYQDRTISPAEFGTRAEYVIEQAKARYATSGAKDATFFKSMVTNATAAVKELVEAKVKRDKASDSSRFWPPACAAVKKVVDRAEAAVREAAERDAPVDKTPESTPTKQQPVKLPPIADSDIDAEAEHRQTSHQLDLTLQTSGYPARLRHAVKMLLEARQVGVANEVADAESDVKRLCTTEAAKDRAEKVANDQLALHKQQVAAYDQRFAQLVQQVPQAITDTVLAGQVTVLLNAVKAEIDSISSKDGNVSSNFAADLQATAKGNHLPAAVAEAGKLWVTLHRFAVTDQTYRGPKQKGSQSVAQATSGLPQANFEAPRAAKGTGKVNVHVTVGTTKNQDVYMQSVTQANTQTHIHPAEIIRMVQFYKDQPQPLGVYRSGQTWFSAYDITRLAWLHANVTGRPWNTN